MCPGAPLKHRIAEALIAAYKAAGAEDVADRIAKAAALEKVGARNSQADLARIQAMHDTSVELGAHCAGQGAAMSDQDQNNDDDSDTGDSGGDDTLAAVSRHGRGDMLAKLAQLSARVEALTQRVDGGQASLLRQDRRRAGDAEISDRARGRESPPTGAPAGEKTRPRGPALDADQESAPPSPSPRPRLRFLPLTLPSLRAGRLPLSPEGRGIGARIFSLAPWGRGAPAR